MDQKKLNALFSAVKSGDYSKLEEIKNNISPEDYQKALNLFNQYSGKSEAELLKELSKLKGTIENQEEIVNKIKPFLNEEQKKKLEQVLQFLDEE